ncbi:MAG: site-specific integrase [Actinomycetota bacterium]|nr:site-specific integrase [Actinomycetota bacterium]
MSGRVYRRCGCRTQDGKLAGASCPRLAADDKHGSWGFAVDLPSLEGKRKTMRRGGFTTKREAARELGKVTARVGTSVKIDDRETVAKYLDGWLQGKRLSLKPKTFHSYSEYVNKRIVPILGPIRLESLRHEHVVAFVDALAAEGRGAPTIKSILAVLRSALGDAVRTRRLTHNPAEHVRTPDVEGVERVPWTVDQAAHFLDHVAEDRLAELFELIAGTGLRRGEALALRWSDVDLERRVLRVRRSVTDVAGRLVIGKPKTAGSAAGVGLSPRVVAALQRQRERQVFEALEWADGYEDSGLVFTRENGTMLRPEYVLRRFHELSADAGLPLVRVHDLRHLAATLMLTAGVPLALVSKKLRHSKVGITSDLYGHLTHEAAQAAADSLGGVLDAATARLPEGRPRRDATTLRPRGRK